MSKETLNTFRLLLPGLMLYILLLPAGKGSLNPTVIIANLGTIEDLFYLIAAFFLGGLYYAFDMHGRLHRPELNYIHYNIHRRLLEPFRSDDTIARAQDRLRKEQTLLDIFYFLVDNDESLRERAKNVQLNGLVWTSVMDVTATGLIATAFYIVLAVGMARLDYVGAAIACGAVAAFAYYVLLPRLTQRHIVLSDEQLMYITSQKRKDLHAKLLEAASVDRKWYV
jgi:hypothetical protein